MRKPGKRKDTSNSTPIALMLAMLFGAGGFYSAEIIYGNIKDSGASDLYQFPGWRAHMGSACVGVIAFLLCLFLLESLGKGSKRTALRSITPWTPLAALTGVATVIHIPTYIVLLMAAVYSPWAYLRTCAVR